MNSAHLVGRVGQDPELRHSKLGQPVTNLSLVTNEYWTDREGKRQHRAEWHRLVFWDKQAELVDKYVRRGDRLGVEGRLQTRPWVDKQGVRRHVTEIVVLRLHLLSDAQQPEETAADDGAADEEEIPY